jgi:eukaryotic-like serine/threonine-protein kinase
MSRILTCPDEHELLVVATGEPAAAAIDEHLESCPGCRQRLERLRAELAALRRDFEEKVDSPSTEPDPAVDHAGEPSSDGTTLDWASDPVETAGSGPLGPEAVAAARDRAETQAERPGAIGKYLVVETLGSGAQGKVYRVIHPGLGQNMVLKLGRRPVGGDERATLVQEGRLLKDLKHINLVKIFDLDFHNEQPFLVMEYVHGGNLEDFARDEPVTPHRAADLVAKLAGALAMVHRRSIIHRDIKPLNILIDEMGQPRLIDFGLARLRNAWSDRSDGTWGGTLAYMAPEQARLEHDRIGPRSDIFGLGAVFYFLLTGRAPFVGETQDEVWDRARRCDFEAGALRLAKVPRRLERICLKALAADPADRYATADQMGRALKWSLDAPRRIGVAAGLLLALAISYAIYQRPTSPRTVELGSNASTPAPTPSTTPSTSPAHPAPWRGEINLWVDEPGNSRRHALRLHQTGAVPVKTGDEVRVEAWVNRPAYLYLFWLGSDGKVAPLYPWKEHDWSRRPAHEDKVNSVELPEAIDETMVLPPSAPGLETLVLLARDDSPLPRDVDATLERDLAGIQTTQLPDGMRESVWLENGQEFVLVNHGDKPTRSAPSAKTRKNVDPVLRIRELLRKKLPGLGEYHGAVIVPNNGGR